MIVQHRYCGILLITTVLCFFASLLEASIEQEQAVECSHPSNYSDFTVLLVNNTIIATGGNSHVLQVWQKDLSPGLDTRQNCWTELYNNSESINTTSYAPYKNGIGFRASDTSFFAQSGDSTSATMSNLVMFDTVNKSWSTPIVHGNQPSPRARMSVTLNTTTNIAWFYGGRTELSEQASNYFNSFYSYDIQQSTWSWPETLYSGGCRPARYGHSSNLIAERLFVIGGKTAVFSNDSNSWTLSSGDFQSVLIFDTVQHQSVSMATIGDIPPARFSFSTVNGPDAKSIVLFGGQNATDKHSFDASNEVYVLDTCTLNWSQPVISGTPPAARAGHEAVVYKDRYMIVMMGIQNYDSNTGPIYTDETAILDMESWTWINSIPPADSIAPSANTIPSCRFTFPVVIPDTDGDSNDNNSNNSGNTTVVSNTNKSPTITQLAVGITFGVLGFLLLTTGAVIFIMRIRKDVDARQNPRWIPGVFRRKQSGKSPLSVPSTAY